MATLIYDGEDDGGPDATRRRLVVATSAVGGMAVPALIFTGINLGTPENLSGWAIPAATDIAFALGILALLGPRVPVALKVFMLGIAIIDEALALADAHVA